MVQESLILASPGEGEKGAKLCGVALGQKAEEDRKMADRKMENKEGD
jgi:hypothetical protein